MKKRSKIDFTFCWDKIYNRKMFMDYDNNCVGGLFDVSDRYEETAFRHAVEKVNEDTSILSRSRLSALWERVPSSDSFHASKKGAITHFSIALYLHIRFIVIE